MVKYTEKGSTIDKERAKFMPDSNDDVAVRVLSTDPLPIEIVGDKRYGDILNEYQDVNAVVKDVETTVLSYLVPASQTLSLLSVSVSGTNKAKYIIYKDSELLNVSRTYYTEYNKAIQFYGLEIMEGERLIVKVIHSSDMTGDFEANMIGGLE